EEEAHGVLATVVDNIQTHREFLAGVDRSMLVGAVFNMLVAAVTCLKHEGFNEEREWRVIYVPQMFHSALMESAVEVIGGIPQVVHKLPLDEKKSDVLRDLDLTRMFDRLIVGPSQFAWVICGAFVEEL